jgi:SAM-dependent methyltransferase
MDMTETELKNRLGNTLNYLEIEPFLVGFTQVQALQAAFMLGLIDRLATAPQALAGANLASSAGLDPRGLGLLLDILSAAGVVEPTGLRPDTAWQLSDRFRAALRFRELIECRMDFAHLVTPDLLGRLGAFVASPEGFMQGSALFGLFDYGRCFERTEENLAATRRWVRITSAYTRHEAPVLLRLFDFSRHRRLLDIGGNSGEMARQICEAWPELSATVVDLPLVCEIGRGHVAASPAARRIRFAALDALSAPLPGVDLALFKSVLHDWPDEAAALMLANAHTALAPGGRLVIFERCRGDAATADLGAAELTYGFAPLLLFVPGFRTPSAYATMLSEAGFSVETITTLRLDTRFCLIVARR